MASLTESGLARTVANSDKFVKSIVKIPGYNPSNPNLSCEAIQKASANVKDAMLAVSRASAVYKNAIRLREIGFELLNKFASRIYNTLKASDKNRSDETAKEYVRKIQGRRAGAKRSAEEKKADLEAGIQYNEVSASQMSFDSRLENFSKLINVAVATPSYAPNEEDLKIESLNGLLGDLQQKNIAVIEAQTVLYKARALRNELLNKDETGLIDIMLSAKAYLKGAFGPSSPEFKEVSGLSFRKVSVN